ncbi:hypothetical protein [Virgibacillus siamensis]|uniref:hypothetical protein n=1 Tax=Virgibacillus siamensis TaxID=480071 RepID=UPI000985D84A|nr:hypothetical protein [Virgibacillus siamensis]
MVKTTSLSALKDLAEKKLKKKILIKVMWNDHERITLLITPNMKINSFIYDKKEGYLFYNHEGKLVGHDIPYVLPESVFLDGKVVLERTNSGRLKINNHPLSNEDIEFLKGYDA